MIFWILAIITIIAFIIIIALYEANKNKLKKEIMSCEIKICHQYDEIKDLNHKIYLLKKIENKEDVIVQIPEDKVEEFYGNFNKKTEDLTLPEQYKIFKFMEEIIGNKSDIFSYKNSIKLDLTNVLKPRIIGNKR